MRMAWARLRLPKDWADWLVKLYKQGMKEVRTYYAVKIWNKEGRHAVQYKQTSRVGEATGQTGHTTANEWITDDRGAGFIPQRGTGQEDVMSLAC